MRGTMLRHKVKPGITGRAGFSGMRLWRQDKGQQTCVEAFVAAIGGGRSTIAPIPFEEIMEVSRVAIEAAELARG